MACVRGGLVAKRVLVVGAISRWVVEWKLEWCEYGSGCVSVGCASYNLIVFKQFCAGIPGQGRVFRQCFACSSVGRSRTGVQVGLLCRPRCARHVGGRVGECAMGSVSWGRKSRRSELEVASVKNFGRL